MDGSGTSDELYVTLYDGNGMQTREFALFGGLVPGYSNMFILALDGPMDSISKIKVFARNFTCDGQS